MSYPPRIITRLDIKGPNIVKGIHMEGLRVIGNPNERALEYYRQGADEIVFMDIVASLYDRNQILSVVEEAARDIFIPMTVGGGIRTIENVEAVLRSGADKVAINTAAVGRPEFLREVSEIFGSQCIVLSVEAKRQPNGTWECYTDNGRERTFKPVLDWVVDAEQLGVGEILVTSVDRDGTRDGLDLRLFEEIHKRVHVPVIASGGAGNSGDVIELFSAPHAEAACCGSIFHYDLCPLPALKNALESSGIDVRR